MACQVVAGAPLQRCLGATRVAAMELVVVVVAEQGSPQVAVEEVGLQAPRFDRPQGRCQWAPTGQGMPAVTGTTASMLCTFALSPIHSHSLTTA